MSSDLGPSIGKIRQGSGKPKEKEGIRFTVGGKIEVAV